MTWEFVHGQGKHQVKLQMQDTGNGWCGLLSGGETPHLGGVVMAVPRDSLTGVGRSCDLWITPVPGHKDTEAAAPLARQICLYVDAVVTISAGIHIDNATEQDIISIHNNCQKACQAFYEEYQQIVEVE